MALCNPLQQWLDNNGKPLAAGRLYAYLAGTTTPTGTWQDSGLSILNTNPVILDAAGYSLVWLNPSTVYKFRMTDRWGVQMWTVDNVSGNLLCAPSGGGPSEPGGPPTVTSISPNSGPVAGGNQVVITGTNFDVGATVTFNGTPATSVGISSLTSIVATVPTGTAGTVSVTVTVNAQSATLANAYTYVSNHITATSISPASGPTTGGGTVTITGTNFLAGATVTIQQLPATNVVVVSPTSITATVPAGGLPGLATVIVTNPDGQVAYLYNAYTYGAVPTVTSVSPASGPANTATPVTIMGTNFVTGATVTFGGVAATNVVVTTATTITCVTPARAAGTVAVAVTTVGQTITLNNAYTYVQVAPIYSGLGGPGVAGATSVSSQSGTTVTLNTGDVLNQVQTTPETPPQTFSFASSNLNGQFMYLLLAGGAHTLFWDQNNNTMPMSAPITVTVGSATMYLYRTQNQLYGLGWQIQVRN